MGAAADVVDLTRGLLALSRDHAVTRVLARTRRDAGGRDVVTVDVTRNGSVVREPLIQEPADLHRLAADLLGRERACGSVGVRGLQGLAAVPPAADGALLVLERWVPPRPGQDREGTVPLDAATTAAAVLGAGAGVVLGGAQAADVAAALRAVVNRLDTSVRLVMVEDGPPVPVKRDAIRLREAPSETLAALRRSVFVFYRAVPPCLPTLFGAVLVVVSARTPEATLARLITGISARPAVVARLCADAAPLFLWLDGASQDVKLHAVYEILPQPAAGLAGLPALQMLAGTDPETGALIPTGAVPVDAAVRAAFNLS